MNKKDFLKAIRQDGATFRADKITIDTRNGKISGKGTVRISNNRFLFDVTIDEPANVPIITTGIFGRSQFWIVSGRIEDNIEFHFEGVPSGYTDHYGHHSWKVMHFSSSIMDLDPCGWDQLTIPEQKSVLKEITEKTLLEPGQPLKTVSEDDISTMRTETNAVDVWFEARLLDFKLIAFNGQTTITVTNAFLGSTLPSVASDTFHGEFQDWKFGLIQREKDLEIYFRSKVGYKSQSDESDQKLFRAFLDAVAFAHGQHCWPFLMEHRRDGKLIQDRIHLTSDVAQTAHTPFTQAFVFNEHVTKSQWQFSNPLEKAYIFFSTDSKLSRQVARLLYLFREATKSGVPKDVVLLILCSLFESLLHAAYDEELAPLKEADRNAFEAAKKEALDAVNLKATHAQSPASYNRITAILTSAAFMRPKDKFDELVNHWQLKPKEHWDEIFKIWKDYRHPLSHSLSDNDDSEPSIKKGLLAESKIAGAIICIVLKLMGYSGLAQASVAENTYIKI